MLLRKEFKTVLKQGVLILMPLAMLFSCLYDTISDDEIVFVAVGQGDSVHIRAEGHDVLIDGGGQAEYGEDEEDEDSGYNVGKNILMPYLMHGGADTVDMALVTHLHADHYKGIQELSEIFPVGAVGIPADYRDADTGFKGKVIFVNPSAKIEISDEVYIETIWPVEVSDEPVAADDPNEHNSVYMIHYNNLKIMVTGDLLEEDFAVAVADCGRGMLVQFGRLGMERQEIMAGVVFIVTDLAGHRPEIGVDIEEIHVNGDLHAFPLQVLFLIGLLHNDDLTVRDGGYHGLASDLFPNGNPVEPGDESHETDQKTANDPGQRSDGNKPKVQGHQQQGCEPGSGYGRIAIFIDAHISI